MQTMFQAIQLAYNYNRKGKACNQGNNVNAGA